MTVAELSQCAQVKWEKVTVLKERLFAERSAAEQIDFLVWLDTDYLIRNFDVTFAAIVGADARNESVGIIYSNDPNGLNSGALMLRNSALGRQMLDEWLARDDLTSFRSDQKALRDVFRVRGNLPTLNGTSKDILGSTPHGHPSAGFSERPECMWNSPITILPLSNTYVEGSFCMHFYGW